MMKNDEKNRNKIEIEIAQHEEFGLIYVGNNDEGEPEYLGTNEEWTAYDNKYNK